MQATGRFQDLYKAHLTYFCFEMCKEIIINEEAKRCGFRS